MQRMAWLRMQSVVNCLHIRYSNSNIADEFQSNANELLFRNCKNELHPSLFGPRDFRTTKQCNSYGVGRQFIEIWYLLFGTSMHMSSAYTCIAYNYAMSVQVFFELEIMNVYGLG